MNGIGSDGVRHIISHCIFLMMVICNDDNNIMMIDPSWKNGKKFQVIIIYSTYWTKGYTHYDTTSLPMPLRESHIGRERMGERVAKFRIVE